MKHEDFEEELPFRPRKRVIGKEQIRESWRNIHGQIREPEYQPRRAYAMRAAVVAAAVVCLVIMGVYFLIPRQRTIETSYGEIKKVYLPDSTLVVLNSNSSLNYSTRWDPDDRVVYLQGEAFFDVRKMKAGNASGTGGRSKLTVRTKLLDVEVKGTVFNVNAGLAGRTEVALSEGRVLLKTKDKLSGGIQSISMEPGEVVVVEDDSYSKTKTEKVLHRSAWINNDFYFDSTPISEVATMIKRKYGYQVYFEHDSLRKMELSGNMHAENFIQFKRALEVTMKMNLTLRSDTLFIRPAVQ